jgi:hypothetical protein
VVTNESCRLDGPELGEQLLERRFLRVEREVSYVDSHAQILGERLEAAGLEILEACRNRG